MIYEIRFHGRGGQGTVTAADLLVKVAVAEGKWGTIVPVLWCRKEGCSRGGFC